MAPSIRRLLFVTDAPGFGGAERYLLDMAGAARRRGIEPHILWLRLPESDPRTFAGAGDGDVPLTVVTPDRTRSWRGLAGAVREVLVRWNPDALIVNACGRLRFWSLTWMARRHGIPALWVQHMVEGRDPRQLRPGRLGGRMEGLALWRIPQALRHRLAAAAATSVIVSSQRDRESIVRWHRVPPAKVCVIAPGVDVNRFRFDAAAGQRLRVEWGRARRRNLEAPGEPFLVGTAARLVAGKGAERLIAAVAQLHRRKRNVLAVIAGGGPQRDALAGLAQARGVADHVLVVDFVADMPAFYSALDMFALCSDTESFGLTLAEAMACERPVVATPTAGARLQIVHRVTGHQLEGFSAGELADALDRLAHAPGLREHMGRQGRQRVIDCFCIERTLDRTLAALRHHRAMTCRPVGEAAVIGPAGRPIASLAPFSGR